VEERRNGTLELAQARRFACKKTLMRRTIIASKPDPVTDAYKKDIDRTLPRENLRLTVQERFENLMKLQRFAHELRTAGQSAKKRP